MSRITTKRSLRWTPLLAAALLIAAALPTQAGSNWIKTFDRIGEAQGLAAAPNGGFYVGDSRTDTGAAATISRYTATGGKTWATSLGTGGVFIRGVASDPTGNAYVTLYRSTPTVDGYQYQVQQVKPNGTLGWSRTWFDSDASLVGQVIAARGGVVYVAERDTSTTTTTIRRFATADGTPDDAWTLTGPTAPADRPTQLVMSAQGTYLLDRSGVLLRLKANGSIQWRKSVPGPTDRGSMGVDAAGLSVAYDEDFADLRVRRFSLAGVKKWDKPVPWSGGTLPTATSAGGQTYTIGTPWVNDSVQNQLLIAHLDANGKVVGKVTIGTPKPDAGWFMLPVGDHVFVAGYDWTNNPLIARAKLP